MEITNRNFKECLPLVSKAVEEATFLAIDTEFSGLSTSGHGIHAYDTPGGRYQKLRQGSIDFLLMQFGLCAFKHDVELNRYEVKAFNFYIFPRPFSRQAPDVRFTCQSSSIEFLISQGFDFNKVFKEGISYLPPTEEQRLRESLEQKYKQIDKKQNQQHFSSPAFTSPSTGDAVVSKGPIQVPDEHKQFLEDICKQIEEFLDSDNKDELSLEPCNGYLRKLTYQTVAQRFKTQVHLEARTDSKRFRYIAVTKVGSEEEMRLKEEKKRAAEFGELDDAVGFTKVTKMISQSGKLIVGHNMLLDVLHILNRFSFPLPEDYEDFKSMVRCIYPRIIDTKLMAASPHFKEHILHTALDQLRMALESKPFTPLEYVTAEGFPAYSTSEGKLHEAGYDAYITGMCFANMANHLGGRADPPQSHVPPNSALLEPFLNRLNFMRVYDIPYLNLAGPEEVPCRDHVFHIAFPKEWKATDISQLFSPFGSVHIAWLDDSSAFVALHKRDQAEHVLKSLSCSENYRVMSYQDFTDKKTLESTPSQSLKRKVPSADLDLPPRRKRSRGSDSGSPFPIDRSITTIPEEEEGDEKMPLAANFASPSAEEDLGVPVKRKKSQ